MVTHDRDLFRMSASPIFCSSNGRGAGDSPERASRSEAEELHIDQTAQEMSVIGVDVSLEHLDIVACPAARACGCPTTGRTTTSWWRYPGRLAREDRRGRTGIR